MAGGRGMSEAGAQGWMYFIGKFLALGDDFTGIHYTVICCTCHMYILLNGSNIILEKL